MLKDLIYKLEHPEDTYLKIIAEKAIFSLNHFAREKYSISAVTELIKANLHDPESIFRMLNLVQDYKNEPVYAESELSREAILALAKGVVTDLKALLAYSQNGEEGKKILQDKLYYKEFVLRKLKKPNTAQVKDILIKLIAQKALQTMNHLSAEPFTLEEVEELIRTVYLDETDLDLLLNLHRKYGAGAIGEAKNKLVKESVVLLAKDKISLQQALTEHDPLSIGRQKHKYLHSMINNIKFYENQRYKLLQAIAYSGGEINQVKTKLKVKTDYDLLKYFQNYELVDFTQKVFPAFFSNYRNDQHKEYESLAVTVRLVFAQYIINGITEEEDLCRRVFGHTNLDNFSRAMHNSEIISDVYQIRFAEYKKIADQEILPGKTVNDLVRERIVNGKRIPAQDPRQIETMVKKYNLHWVIEDLHWNYKLGELKLDRYENFDLKKVLAEKIAKYGTDISLIQSLLKLDQDIVLNMITGNAELLELYEHKEQEDRINAVISNIKKYSTEELQKILRDNHLTETQRHILENEVIVREPAQAQNDHKKEKAKQKSQDRKELKQLRQEFKKIQQALPENTRNQTKTMLSRNMDSQELINNLITKIEQLNLNDQAKLYLAAQTENSSFLILLGLADRLRNKLQKNIKQLELGHKDQSKLDKLLK